VRLFAFALGIVVGVLIVRRDEWQTLWSRDTVNASGRMVALGFPDYDYLA
jgi:hypothetical protein